MNLAHSVLDAIGVGALTLLAACGSQGATASDSETRSTPGDNRRQLVLLDSDTRDEASIALYQSTGMSLPLGKDPPPSRQLIAAAWQKGRVVWRTGPPQGSKEVLATAEIEPERVQQLARELVESLSAWNGNNFFPPDSSYQTIDVRYGGRSATVATGHELFERDPRLVCLDGGVRSVQGGTREEILAREATPSWLAFRTAWSSMRTQVDEIVRVASDRGSDSFLPERVRWVWK